jgi:hydrogenase nickel incorporation protein HypA/HybF
MHEMGIASSIVDTVTAEAQKRPGTRLLAVGLRLGEVSGVSAEALEFCFQSLVKGTELEPIGLEIERSPRRHRCPQCGCEFDVVDYDPTCPKCGEFSTALISGDEMEIVYLEVEDG